MSDDDVPQPGYGTRLAAIRAAAAADGVAVEVDLHGALVDLRFDRWALHRSPAELAGLIRRLAAQAGADALRQGREVLGDLLPDDPATPRPRRPPAPEDDTLVPATWAT
ncbi:hypothetical protein [Amycolatopsis plumensis]|uniref:YbaB/EbfC DNA-binding family protein n=1 Tax=Amycolatopsis plumensis TaxID=236508 RepID=A0ABV5U269_9PSEU